MSIFRVKRSHTGTNIRGCKPVTVYFQKYEDKEEILRYFRIEKLLQMTIDYFYYSVIYIFYGCEYKPVRHID